MQHGTLKFGFCMQIVRLRTVESFEVDVQLEALCINVSDIDQAYQSPMSSFSESQIEILTGNTS